MSFQQVRHHFPKAVPLDKLVRVVSSVLREHHVYPKNTLLAVSTCVDELERRLERAFSAEWNPAFMFGGLAGYPFAGLVGMIACLDHVPENGNLLLVYASHVGIDKDGTVGYVERRGIEHVETCCGSAIAAYHNRKDEGEKNCDIEHFQQNYVNSVIHRNQSSFDDDFEKDMVKLPKVVRKQIFRNIQRILPQSDEIPIILLGGININTEKHDYFQLSDFIIYRNGERHNLTKELEKSLIHSEAL